MPESRPTRQIEIGDAASVLAAVIEHADVCVKLVDLDGRIMEWNGACECLYGWRAEDVLGASLPHVPLESRASAIAFLRSVAASGEVKEREVVALDVRGWRHNLVLTAIPVADADGHIAAVLTIAREVLSGERARSVGDEVSELIARLFGEPLGAISNTAALLQRRDVVGDPARRAQLVAHIAQLSREARDLLDDLRVVAGDPDGIVVHDRERVDMGILVAEVAAGLVRDADRVLVDFAAGTAPADVDRARIVRAVDIMLRGAIAGARRDSQLHASVRRAGPSVAVEIRYRGSVAEVTLMQGAQAGEAMPSPNQAVMAAWSGSRYVEAVARAHHGRFTTTGVPGEEITAILTVPGAWAVVAKGALSRDRE